MRSTRLLGADPLVRRIAEQAKFASVYFEDFIVDNSLLDLQDLFRSVAAKLRELLQSEPTATGWSNAKFDLRYSTVEGAGWASQLQVTVAGSSIELGVSDHALQNLIRQIRAVPVGEPFYGFILVIEENGKVDIRLNYDKKCYSDPAFWAP